LALSDQTLTAAVLPTGRLALEFEACEETISTDRRQIEAKIHEIYDSDHAKAFLALGCISHTFRLSPSIEYWRSISTAYIHELLVDPQTEVLREKQAIDLPHEKAVQWAGLAPAMVGAEWVDTDFIGAVWTLFHDAFAREVRGRCEPVEEILRQLAPGQAQLEHRVISISLKTDRKKKRRLRFWQPMRTAMQPTG
jgi:hypothetical protein